MTPDRGRHWVLPSAALIAIAGLFVGLYFLRGDDAVHPLERGAQWLALKQGADGAWRGEEIAVLRPGPAMTAFVLYAMTRLPAPLRANYAERMTRAVRYLESQINSDGIVGMTPDGPDYPTYATALTVFSFVPLDKPESVSRMVDYLKRSQLDEEEGWAPGDPEYGGWGFGGPARRKPDAHRLDISTTRFVLEALAAARVSADEPVWARARSFIERLQNEDGGFRFTPLQGQNKAEGLNSYGSATADGLLSLKFIGSAQARIEKAHAWIRNRFTADSCPGFPPDHPRPWASGLHGYWLASAVRLVDAASVEKIAQAVIARQRSDGSWVNPSDVMLENEPILGTTLAVLALSDANRLHPER